MKKALLGLAALSAISGGNVYAQSASCVGCEATPNPTSPDCPAGTTWQQQATGVWTCLAPAPIGGGGGAGGGGGGGGATTEDEKNVCIAKAQTVSVYPINPTPFYVGGPYPSVGSSAWRTPDVWDTGNATYKTSPALYAGTGSFDPPAGAANDMFFIQGGKSLFNQSLNFCFVQPGTTNIVGFYNFANIGINDAGATPPNPPSGTAFSLQPRSRWYNPSGSFDGLCYQGQGGTILAQ